MLRRPHIIPLLGLVSLVAAGCRTQTSTTPAPTPVSTPPTTNLSLRDSRALPILLQPTDRPVVQGRLPLVYLAETDGQLKVIDIQAGKILGVFKVRSGEIVRVGTGGITVGRNSLLRQTLASELYAISVVPPETNLQASQEKINTIDITPSAQTTDPTTTGGK
jgi:hypothetical protein